MSDEGKTITVKAAVKMQLCIQLALDYLAVDGQDKVIISGEKNAMAKCISISEILRRKLQLHQISEISYKQSKGEKVSSIEITLSKKQLDTDHLSYQAPLPLSEMQTESK